MNRSLRAASVGAAIGTLVGALLATFVATRFGLAIGLLPRVLVVVVVFAVVTGVEAVSIDIDERQRRRAAPAIPPGGEWAEDSPRTRTTAPDQVGGDDDDVAPLRTERSAEPVALTAFIGPIEREAQCPACGYFDVGRQGSTGDERPSGTHAFVCSTCGTTWSWTSGTSWPRVFVRPDAGRPTHGGTSATTIEARSSDVP